MKSRYYRKNRATRSKSNSRSKTRSYKKRRSIRKNRGGARSRTRPRSRSKSRSRSRKNNLRRRKRRNRLSGGNANTLPLEYFGGKSGRYHHDTFVNKGTHDVYGEYTPQSFGEPFDNSSNGPNLFVHPNSSGKQTDGPN